MALFPPVSQIWPVWLTYTGNTAICVQCNTPNKQWEFSSCLLRLIMSAFITFLSLHHSILQLLFFLHWNWWHFLSVPPTPVFEEPEDPSARSFFSEIISSVSDVKFSHSGRYLLTRDYLTAKVWDLNMESKPLETYQVCDRHYNDNLGCSYKIQKLTDW